ncbi:hypothetical protein LTR94_035910, partial [Friedmanniomyces endolithicus]
MVLFATYEIFADETQESFFNALAAALFIVPFFLLSALAGQLADSMDKARIIRIVKTAEIAIMAVGAGGLMLARTGAVTAPLVLMLVAVDEDDGALAGAVAFSRMRVDAGGKAIPAVALAP